MALNNWTNFSTDLLWQTASNWSLGHVPTAGDDVVVAGSDAIVGGVNGPAPFESIDFSAFHGSLDMRNSGFFVNGAIIFSADMTFTDSVVPGQLPTVNFSGDGELTSAGQSLFQVIMVDTATSITFHDPPIITGQFWQNATAAVTINQGPNVITCATASDGYGFFIEGGGVAAWNWTAGAKLVLAPTGTNECDIENSVTAVVWPPIEVDAGTGKVGLIYSDIPATSLHHISGQITFNPGFDFALDGDWTVEAGASYAGLTGHTQTIGGDFSDDSVDLDGGAWNVTGTAIASTCTITDSDFSGGSALDATTGCTDGGGNTNVTFAAAPAPTISDIDPLGGAVAGGTAVTITGTGFDSVSGVTFDGDDATDVVTVDDTTATCTTPAHLAGAVDVVLTNGDSQTATAAAGFTYDPAPTIDHLSPSHGGIGGGEVDIIGTGFVGAPAVTFGGAAAAAVRVIDGTRVRCAAPAHAAGAVDVVVTIRDSQSATAAAGFTYDTPVTQPHTTAQGLAFGLGANGLAY